MPRSCSASPPGSSGWPSSPAAPSTRANRSRVAEADSGLSRTYRPPCADWKLGHDAGLLRVSFRPLTDLERRADVELPVHALLPWPEVRGRLSHRDHLGLVDLV